MNDLLDLAKRVDVREAQNHSFKDYHVKGLDYLCLFRSNQLTLKAYFFDEGLENHDGYPHTHRYSFMTRVLRGELKEDHYIEILRRGLPFVEYEYDTVLDNGEGFSLKRAVTLEQTTGCYAAGGTYFNGPHSIHMLKDIAPKTVLLITQYADVEKTSLTYSKGEPPNFEGLYASMDVDEVRARLEEVAGLL